MDQSTLDLMLSCLEGSPEESVSDNNSLADGLELLDNQCEGNCYRQLKLVLQRANSIIKLKNSQCKDKDEIIKLKVSQCKDKDELIKLKDGQCSAMKDEIILHLKKSIEMQHTIDLLKTLLKCKENPVLADQTETQNQNSESHENQIKELQLVFNQHEDKFVDYETNLKEKDNQISKLQNDFAHKIQKLNDNFQKQMFVLEKTLIETKGSFSNFESKLQAARSNHKRDELVKKPNCPVFGSSSWLPFVPKNNTNVVHIKLPVALSFTAPVENCVKEAGPGWLVMQRRLNGKVDFDRKDITDFYNGFGDMYGDFWLGLEKVHQLTITQHCQLFIHLVDSNDIILFVVYDHFIVGGQDENYKLRSLGNCSGNSVDAMRACEHKKFEKNFWSYNFSCNLNGVYSTQEYGGFERIRWNGKTDLKLVQMLIKPK